MMSTLLHASVQPSGVGSVAADHFTVCVGRRVKLRVEALLNIKGQPPAGLEPAIPGSLGASCNLRRID